MAGQRWNSNLHAFESLLTRVPTGCHRGLDVGCGEGETARRLRRIVPNVVGVDVDQASIDLARERGGDIDYRVQDFLAADIVGEPFDVVTAVAVVHHVDHRAALRRLRHLVAPGGRLIIVGLARAGSVADLVRDGRDSIALRRHSLLKGVWETPAPKVWPPTLDYRQARRASEDELPDCEFARVPYRRYGVTWTRPAG